MAEKFPPQKSYSEKLEVAKQLKQEGNEFYKKGEAKKALGKYHRALLYAKGIHAEAHDRKKFQFAAELSDHHVTYEVLTQAMEKVSSVGNTD